MFTKHYILLILIPLTSCTPPTPAPSAATTPSTPPTIITAPNPNPLFAALKDIDTLDTLYNQGHPIDSLDAEGLTLLHHATSQESVATVKWLLDHGAASSGSPSTQQSPLSITIDNSKLIPLQAIPLSNAYTIMQLLIKAGADPMAHYNNQPSAIQHAMDIQCEPCISFMKKASLSRATTLAK
jgi:ankyrin repeat protein